MCGIVESYTFKHFDSLCYKVSKDLRVYVSNRIVFVWTLAVWGPAASYTHTYSYIHYTTHFVITHMYGVQTLGMPAIVLSLGSMYTIES